MKRFWLLLILIEIPVLYERTEYLRQSAALDRKIAALNQEVARLAEDVGELKQQAEILLKRDHPDD
ncbi:MAG: hypothetical protein QOD99_1955 [Chthoniobacter sp.]|nr:hypothetical protein [Chthoniobacter sp.]